MQEIMIPTVVTAADLETAALRPDAYILTCALSTIKIATLEFMLHTYVRFDPNDKDAEAIFYKDPKTIGYWHGRDNPDYAPSERARLEAFGGTTPIMEGLPKLVNHLESFKNMGQVLTSRGPDFDMPIIRNALQQCNLYQGPFMKVSLFDSDRTAERLAKCLGWEINEDVERERWIVGDFNEEHMAPYDAAKEAYTTARAYHLCCVFRLKGGEAANMANNLLREGKYEPREFL